MCDATLPPESNFCSHCGSRALPLPPSTPGQSQEQESNAINHPAAETQSQLDQESRSSYTTSPNSPSPDTSQLTQVLPHPDSEPPSTTSSKPTSKTKETQEGHPQQKFSHPIAPDETPLPMPTDSFIESPSAKNGPSGARSPDETVKFLQPNKPGRNPSPPGQRPGNDRVSREEKGRFDSGELLLDRYIVQGRLGEGAMGEVYKAEDRRLGGLVALKFLSASAASDAEGLRRLLVEARLARQVTHPNVCRVFDVGDVKGQTFISMEYIDGETISSLLRRIGRLPSDKAINVAKQICSGLAWAHERGILHRDLKPANIMLDGNGEVRIADFGLAGLAVETQRDKHRAGTPAYMAPEVLRGRGATNQSDIFSLGLILYELFTGKPVYRPTSIAELESLHEQPIAFPSSIVPEIDPSVEKVIMQCLEREPNLRPAHVQDIITMLPGGDPLSAMLNAGQTPSPRLVAASGETGVISPVVAVYLAAAMVAITALALWLGSQTSLIDRIPLNRSLVVLRSDAQEAIEQLGYSAATPYSACAFDLYEEYLALIASKDQTHTRWDSLRQARPAAIDFWYRQSPRPLVTGNPRQQITIQDPPFDIADMINLRLDPRGRLREFEYKVRPEPAPDQPARPQQGPPADWNKVLELAGLEQSTLESTTPIRVPGVFADTRVAWQGTYPEPPFEPIRVEAASFLGKLVSFRIVETNWVEASIVQPATRTLAQWTGTGLLFTVNLIAIVGGLALAAKNLRDRVGDKSGAIRLAWIMFSAAVISIWLRADHPKHFVEEVDLIISAIQQAIPVGLWFWVCYIALEPYIRRTWPETLISWSRFVAGDVLNPLVGLHVAVGSLCGVACACLAYMHRMSSQWIKAPPSLPWIDPDRGVVPLQGAATSLGAALEIIPYAARFSITFLVVLLLVKLLVNKKWIAATIYASIQTAVWTLTRGDTILSPVFMSIVASICTLLLVRFGLLGLVAGVVVYLQLTTFAPSIRLWHFTAPVSVTAVAAISAIFVLGLLCAGGAIKKSRLNPLASTSQ